MGFSGPPSEPDVRLSPHPALHVLIPSGSASSASRVLVTPPRSGLAMKHRYSPASSSFCIEAVSTLDPFAVYTAFPCSATTGPPPHSAGIDRRQVFPAMLAGTDEVVPTFTLEPFDGVGAQLCPCNLATATSQSFTVASRPTISIGPGVPRLARPVGCALQPSPYLSGLSWWTALEGLSAAGSLRTPFRLACRTHAI